MTADLAIINATIVPMTGGAPIENGVLTVRDGRIEEVGTATTRPEATRTIDAAGCAVIPGLVNSHTHNASNMLLRSLDEDVELWQWLRSMWAMKRNFDPETLYWASLCGLIEMARGGITCFNEHFDAYAVEPEVRALEEVPLRATLGYGFADRGVYESITDWSWRTLDSFGEKVARHHGRAEGRIQVALSPHAPYSVGAQMWQLAATVAEQHDLTTHTHVAEGMNEVRYMAEEYGTTTVQWLDSLGVLSSRVTAAHCTRLNARDIEILADRDVKIAHCPISNAKLVSGTMDLGAVTEAGITVGLATDGPASHNTMDMFEEMKFAGLIHKDRTQEPTFLPAGQILELATAGSAAAMHRPELGRLVPGAPADITVVDLDRPHTLPAYNAVSTLVYSSRADDVRYTIVAGRVVLDDGAVAGLDERHVRKTFREHALALRARSL
ncbi:amidohydrolase family protein [Ruania zhangjianzhongii]|uniref:amidohydrolase family protein n=1 Tax=Ruania zhangjianzhongii TaxID=2603206 RepID=UPI001AEF8BDD|nr:amidohydrolase [Ruania zhangjianzhongii]